MPLRRDLLSFVSRSWRRDGRKGLRSRSRIVPRFEQLESRQMMYGGVYLDAEAEDAAQRMPDFALLDVNSTSETYDQNVSPRDFLQQVSGWYFTYAT